MTKKRKITKHGLCSHPLHAVWVAMKQRCNNPNNESYANYGGNGVVVCEGWQKDFLPFYNWAIVAGWKEGLELDKDILSPYKTGEVYNPQFCCFVTSQENMDNRSVSLRYQHNGESLSINDLAKRTGLKYKTISYRIELGWSIEKILNTPKIDISRMITFNGETKNLTEWADILGININTLRGRLNRGWSEDEILKTNVSHRNNVKGKSHIIEFGGKTMSVSAWTEYLGFGRNTINSRLSDGWSIEKTMTTPVDKRYSRYKNKAA